MSNDDAWYAATAPEAPAEEATARPRRRRKAPDATDAPDVQAEVLERDPLHESEVDGLAASWKPDGGPEMNRWDGELTDDILSRFRAHCIVGGHHKRPDQRGIGEGGWYLPVVDRRQGETKLAREIAKLRPRVRDPKLFDRLMVDDGSCGGQKWVVNGQRVTSTSIWSAFYACRILELTEGRDVKTVVDLGGGYGHLAHVLAQFFPSVVLVELPIVLTLAREWSDKHPATADKVTLCHPYEEWTGDLVVNTHSFQHMTERNLRWYDARFRENPPACMYLVNRVIKKDGTDVPFSEYPWLGMYSTVDERMVTKRHVEWFGER